MTEHPLLEMRGIERSFPGVHAVRQVDFDLRAGEVHALVGENGAGKSTLMRVLAGVHPPDGGQILLDGRAVHITSPAVAGQLGIAMVHQELKLAPHLSVAENIFLGQLPATRAGLVDWEALNRQAVEALAVLGLSMSVTRTVAQLSVAEMQMVEIAKALRRRARILIMDEPSAVLTPFELAKLFEIIRAARGRGVGIIYISHRLEEIFEIGDRTTVLKDGAKVSTVNVAEVDKWQIVKMMVGRELGKNYPKRSHPIGEAVLEVKQLSRRGRLDNVSFSLRRGEVLGIAGLVGAGRSDLAEVIFGAQAADAGEVRIEGSPVRIRSPKDAMACRVGFLTEDRRKTGLFGWLTVRENISIANLARITRGVLLDLKRELQVVGDLIKRLRIVTPTVDQKVENLSGGNQQRVLLAKWINTDSKIFLIDEPTRGIDVGSKEEFYFLMNDLTSKGAAILMISSELPEILGMSDRILVMNKGRITAEFAGADATEEKIMEFAALEVPR
jgi:ABC-type sugar transport system ATPase subunit